MKPKNHLRLSFKLLFERHSTKICVVLPKMLHRCWATPLLNVDDEVLRKRMEKSIAVHDENDEPMMVNEAYMDFRIPGLPYSVVKYAQSTSVRE